MEGGRRLAPGRWGPSGYPMDEPPGPGSCHLSPGPAVPWRFERSVAIIGQANTDREAVRGWAASSDLPAVIARAQGKGEEGRMIRTSPLLMRAVPLVTLVTLSCASPSQESAPSVATAEVGEDDGGEDSDEAIAEIARRIAGNSRGVGALDLASMPNPDGEGTFVYVKAAASTRPVLWLVLDGQPFILTSAASELAGGLPYPADRQSAWARTGRGLFSSKDAVELVYGAR